MFIKNLFSLVKKLNLNERVSSSEKTSSFENIKKMLFKALNFHKEYEANSSDNLSTPHSLEISRAFFALRAQIGNSPILSRLLVYLLVVTSFGALSTFAYFKLLPSQTPVAQQSEDGKPSVLASTTQEIKGSLGVNVPAHFNDDVFLKNGLTVTGSATLTTAVIQTLTAPNVLYSITAGDGITVTTGQTPTIANSGVLSLGGKTGALKLEAGSGISVDGLKISSSITNPNTFKTITVGSDSFSAGSSTDTLEFAAGTGITLATDTTNKKITITGGSVSGWTDDGTAVRLTTIGDSVGIGTADPSSFKLQVAGNIGPDSDNVYTLGSPSYRFNAIYANSVIGATSGSQGYWQRNEQLLSPSNITDDLAVGGASTASALFHVIGSGSNAGNVNITGSLTIGNATSDTTTFNARVASTIEPTTGSAYDLGSSARRWSTVWGDTANFTNIVTESISLSGTTSNDFNINSDNATDDTQTSTLSFERGGPAVNAQLKWNATGTPSKLFSLNAPLFINQDSGIYDSGTAALIINQIQNQDIFTASASGVTKLVFSNAGNLGIGNTSPISALDVWGTSGTTPIASLSGNTSFAGLVINNNSITGDLFTASSSGLTRFRIANNGEIYGAAGKLFLGTNESINGSLTLYSSGVGITDPSISTDATGALILQGPSGNMTIGETGNATNIIFQESSALTAAASKTLTIGGTNSSVIVNFGDGVTAGTYNFNRTNATYNFGTLTGNITIAGTGGTTPVASISANTSFAGLVVDNKGTGDLFTASSSGLNRFVIKQNGNVGIGTASPSATLDVVGSIRSRSGYSFLQLTNDNVNSAITNNVGAMLFYNSRGTSDTSLAYRFHTTTSDTAVFNILNNGNVGIGTDAGASTRLTVNGAISISNDSGILTLGRTDNANEGGQMDFTGAASYSSWHHDVYQDVMRIWSDTLGAGNNLVLDDGGNLGIVTAAPVARLDVTGGGSALPATSGTAQSAGHITRLHDSTNLVLDVGGVGSSGIWLQSTDKTDLSLNYPLLLNPNGGNVGIGITAPSYKFDVASTTLPQIRFGYNTSNYFTTAISASGAATFNAVGTGASFVFNNAMTLGIGGTTNGSLTFATTGAGEANPSIAANASGDLVLSAPTGTVTVGNGVGDITLDPGTANIVANLTSGNFLMQGNNINFLKFSTLGTLPVASISANTSFAGLVVDNKGTGDLFTASSSGLNRFVIKQNGHVGIGTNTPGYNATGANETMLTLDGPNGAGIELVRNTSVGGYGNGEISWINTDNTAGNQNLAYIQALTTATGTTNKGSHLQFATKDAAVSGLPVERMRITSNGSVGIGTTVPLAALDVRVNLGTTPIASLSGQTSFAGLVVDNKGTGDLFTASSSGLNRFVIKQNGNIGIGTTIPTFGLDVETLNSSSTVAKFGESLPIYIIRNHPNIGFNAYYDSVWKYGKGSSANYGGSISLNPTTGDYAFNISNASGNADATMTVTTPFVIKQNGSIGIGTGSPLATLDVRAALGTTPIASLSGQTSFAGLVVNNNSTTGDLFTASSSGLNRFVIKQNGNVGIGTTIPTATLDIRGTASLSGNLTFDTAATIGTTKNNTLTIGGATSGMLILKSSNAIVFQNPGTENLFVGESAGNNTLSSSSNTAVGYNAGLTLGSGGSNSFFGDSAGKLVSNGSQNSIFGRSAGAQMNAGTSNSFFGYESGRYTTSGLKNSFFGDSAGYANNIGSENSFLGYFAGNSNLDGSGNIFIGFKAGQSPRTANANTAGNYNTFIGYESGPGSTTQLTNATSIGYQAVVNANNALVLGGTGAYAVRVGIGTATPSATLDLRGFATTALASVSGRTSFAGLLVDNSLGDLFTASSSGMTRMVLKNNGNFGVGTATPSSALQVGDQGDGTVAVANAWNNFSDLRFKENVNTISDGLNKVMALNGVSFNWRNSGLPSIGFIAQEVEKVVPEIVNTDANGFKSLDYGKITPLLVNAIHEQQNMISSLSAKLEKLETINFLPFSSIATDSSMITIKDSLLVLGSTTTNDLSVANSLRVGNTLEIGSNSINTIGENLNIQSLKQGNISFMADLVVIDTQGNLRVSGNAEFAKDVKVAGVLSAATTEVIVSQLPVIISATEVTSSASAGTLTFKTGENFLKVNNPNVKSDSLIFVTPKGSTSGLPIYIREQKAGESFTVGVDSALPHDTDFNYEIKNIKYQP